MCTSERPVLSANAKQVDRETGNEIPPKKEESHYDDDTDTEEEEEEENDKGEEDR